MAKYENSNMTAAEMSDLIAAAKAQQLEKNKQQAEQKQHSVEVVTGTRVTTSKSSDIESAEHGSYLVMEDGTKGIVIDHEEEVRKMQERDETGNKLLNLARTGGLITDANQYVPDYGKDAPEGYDPGVEYINQNPYEPRVQKMKEIKESFKDMTFGLHGLVNANTEEGRRVGEALEKIRSGEVVLPTPEEYELQKKEAEERRKKRQEAKALEQEHVPTNTEVLERKPDRIIPDEDELQMAEMPENVIIKKGVDDILNNLNTPQTDVTENVAAPVEEVVETPVSGPINLAGLESELAEEAIEEAQIKAVEENKDTIKPDEIVQINVPKGEAKEVIEQLPLSTYNKIVSAKAVKINEVELKDLPTATTRITDIAAYKRLTRRRPSTKTAEATERVLINSGIVVTLKAATSLEMATIFKSPTSSEMDWEKAYIFCFEHTIGTSIGRLSYNEFCSRVSPMDIETILNGIYEISETDTRKISIICGTDGGCGESYEVEVEIAKLPNMNSLTEESKERVKRIIAAKNSVDESRLIANDSPSSIVKHVQLSEERIVTIRNTTGHMMIERMDRLDDINQTYGAVVALFLLYVENITITIQEREDAAPESFLLDTVELIAEELLTLSDEELDYIKNIIGDDLKDYATMKYSIKGPCRCPNCGNVKDHIDCTMSDLLFQKAQSVLA